MATLASTYHDQGWWKEVEGLQAAADGGHEKIGERLLSQGAGVNAEGGYFGNALQVAFFGGHDKIVERLLSQSAAVNAEGGQYGTALQAAFHTGHDKIVELLLSKVAVNLE